MEAKSSNLNSSSTPLEIFSNYLETVSNSKNKLDNEILRKYILLLREKEAYRLILSLFQITIQLLNKTPHSSSPSQLFDCSLILASLPLIPVNTSIFVLEAISLLHDSQLCSCLLDLITDHLEAFTQAFTDLQFENLLRILIKLAKEAVNTNNSPSESVALLIKFCKKSPSSDSESTFKVAVALLTHLTAARLPSMPNYTVLLEEALSLSLPDELFVTLYTKCVVLLHAYKIPDFSTHLKELTKLVNKTGFFDYHYIFLKIVDLEYSEKDLFRTQFSKIGNSIYNLQSEDEIRVLEDCLIRVLAKRALDRKIDEGVELQKDSKVRKYYQLLAGEAFREVEVSEIAKCAVLFRIIREERLEHSGAVCKIVSGLSLDKILSTLEKAEFIKHFDICVNVLFTLNIEKNAEMIISFIKQKIINTRFTLEKAIKCLFTLSKYNSDAKFASLVLFSAVDSIRKNKEDSKFIREIFDFLEKNNKTVYSQVKDSFPQLTDKKPVFDSFFCDSLPKSNFFLKRLNDIYLHIHDKYSLGRFKKKECKLIEGNAFDSLVSKILQMKGNQAIIEFKRMLRYLQSDSAWLSQTAFYLTFYLNGAVEHVPTVLERVCFAAHFVGERLMEKFGSADNCTKYIDLLTFTKFSFLKSIPSFLDCFTIHLVKLAKDYLCSFDFRPRKESEFVSKFALKVLCIYTSRQENPVVLKSFSELTEYLYSIDANHFLLSRVAKLATLLERESLGEFGRMSMSIHSFQRVNKTNNSKLEDKNNIIAAVLESNNVEDLVNRFTEEELKKKLNFLAAACLAAGRVEEVKILCIALFEVDIERNSLLLVKFKQFAALIVIVNGETYLNFCELSRLNGIKRVFEGIIKTGRVNSRREQLVLNKEADNELDQFLNSIENTLLDENAKNCLSASKSRIFIKLSPELNCIPIDNIPILRGKEVIRVSNTETQAKIRIERDSKIFISNSDEDNRILKIAKRYAFTTLKGNDLTKAKVESQVENKKMLVYSGHNNGGKLISEGAVRALHQGTLALMIGCSAGVSPNVYYDKRPVDVVDWMVGGKAGLVAAPLLPGLSKDFDLLTEELLYNLLEYSDKPLFSNEEVDVASVLAKVKREKKNNLVFKHLVFYGGECLYDFE